MRIVIGADHSGFELKRKLALYLRQTGHAVDDVGTHSDASCDYPDFASLVARAVSLHSADMGIMIDGVGGSGAMVANKFPGIRAVPCHNEFTIRIAREHSDSNLLCLGSKLTDIDEAKVLVDAWLSIPSLKDQKYKNRIDKIYAIEEKHFQPHLLKCASSISRTKHVITEDDVRRAIKFHENISVAQGTKFTPSARDLIKEKNVSVVTLTTQIKS